MCSVSDRNSKSGPRPQAEVDINCYLEPYSDLLSGPQALLCVECGYKIKTVIANPITYVCTIRLKKVYILYTFHSTIVLRMIVITV